MGARSRRKGAAGEREAVQLALSFGLAAERTWHTAQSPDPSVRACDVVIAGLRTQVKRTAASFGPVYRGLEGADVLLLRRDGQDWIACLPAERLFALLRPAPAASIWDRPMPHGSPLP